MPWVGSWPSQKIWSIRSYEVLSGSNATSTTSVWPVDPEHTSSYVGFGV